MSSIASLIADMVREGVDPELIGRAAELLAKREPVVIHDEAADRRRERDRARKAEAKAKQDAETIPQNSAESAEFHGMAGEPLPPCPPAPSPETPNPTPLNPPAPWDMSAPDPVSDAFGEWNQLAADLGLARAQKLTSARRGKLKSRLRDAGGIDGWRHALDRIRGSPFLRGENRDHWRADLDFVLQEKSFTKLMEGAYDPRTGDTPDDFDDLVRAVVAGDVAGGHAGAGDFG
jgi:hypothetical protein